MNPPDPAAYTDPPPAAAPVGEVEFGVAEFALLTKQFLWALTWHDMSGRELLLCSKVLTLSFCRQQPFAWLQYQTDLSTMLGMGRSHVSTGFKILRADQVMQVSEVLDGWLVTPLPPTRGKAWNRRSRFKNAGDELRSRQIEAQLARVRYPEQMEFLPPEADREFQDALTIATLRASLDEAHQRATQAIIGGTCKFPVTVRLPISAPASREASSSSEGLTRPLGTGCSEEEHPSCTPDSFAEPSPYRPDFIPRPPVQDGEDLWEKSEWGKLGVPEKGTCSQKGNESVPTSGTPINDINASMSSGEDSPKSINALNINGCSQKRNSRELPRYEELPFLDPGADENEVMDWLRWALGFDIIDGDPDDPSARSFGGWWRVMYRNHRAEVIDVCQTLRLRVRDVETPFLKSRGGTMRDLINRGRKRSQLTHH